MSRCLRTILKASLCEVPGPFDRGELLAASAAAGATLTALLDEDPQFRCQFYRLLLLGTAKKDVPQSFASHTSSASEEQRMLAAELLAVLDRPAVRGEEVEGMLYYFAIKTGLSGVDEAFGSVLLTMARAINVPEVADEAILQLLFMLVYQVHTKLMPHPAADSFSGCTQELFRLLLQYHHPPLSVHFDHLQFTFSAHAYGWVKALFSTRDTTALHSTLHLWDVLFLAGDSLLPPFLAVAMLADHSASLLAARTRHDLQSLMDSFRPSLSAASEELAADEDAAMEAENHRTPCAMSLPPSKSWASLLQKARLMLRTTPLTARVKTERFLFPDAEQLQRDPKEERDQLLSHVTLFVDVEELVNAFSVADAGLKTNKIPHLHFVVLDCRSESSFNFARLPTAIHVGGEIGFDASLLGGMVDRFSSARGSHLCILGTGRNLVEEANLLKVIALHLVRCGFPFVSIADGGFKAVIPYIKKGQIEYVRSPQPEKSSAPTVQCVPSIPKSAHPQTQPEPAAAATEELKRRAEELKARAAEGVAVARGWGASIFRSLSENFTNARSTLSADPVSMRSELPEEAAGSSAAKPATATNATHPVGSTLASHSQPQAEVASSPARPSAGGAVGSEERSANNSDNVFSLGRRDDDDDDLDLILAVAASPPQAEVPAAHPRRLDTADSSAPMHLSSVVITPPRAGTAVETLKSPEPAPPVPAAKPTAAPSSSVEKHPFDDLFT
jgi:hypothetical protein